MTPATCPASGSPRFFPLLTGVFQAYASYLNQEPLMVDTGVKTGVRIRYEDPTMLARTGSGLRGGEAPVRRSGLCSRLRDGDHVQRHLPRR